MILLDTQSVVWLNQEQELLSVTAKEAIANCRERGVSLAISGMTLWEFAMAGHRGRVILDVPLALALRELEKTYTVLPITAQIAELSVMFSADFPRDPSDRLIAATALAHHVPLITADARIRQSGEVPTIW